MKTTATGRAELRRRCADNELGPYSITGMMRVLLDDLDDALAVIEKLLDAQVTAEELCDHIGGAECFCDLEVGMVCEACQAKNAWGALKRAREAAEAASPHGAAKKETPQ